MTSYLPIPNHTSQRAHAAAGHVARVKSIATGFSTPEALRSAGPRIDLAIADLQALKRELKLVVKRGAA